MAPAAANVQARDVAPIVSLSGSVSVFEGVPYVLARADIIDPCADGAAQYVVNWSDGGQPTTVDAVGDVANVYRGGKAERIIAVELITTEDTMMGQADRPRRHRSPVGKGSR